MKNNKNSGFTLIELVVVIIILAVLAVTALPRFLNFQRDAHESLADGAFSSFASAVHLYHSKWLTQGEPTGVVSYGNGDIYPSKAGFPLSVGEPPLVPTNSSQPTIRGEDCVKLWHALTQNDLTIRAQHEGSGHILPSNTDIVSWYTSSDECYYYYTPGYTKKDELPVLYYSPQTGLIKKTTGRASS